MIRLDWEDVSKLAWDVYEKLQKRYAGKCCRIYPVPRGGVYAALLLKMCSVAEIVKHRAVKFIIVDDPEFFDDVVVIDDIIDTGATKAKFDRWPFYALCSKEECGDWVEFPWERLNNETGPEENITRILEFIGEDPKREGLKETPARVIRSYEELFGGYRQDPKDVLKVFSDGACDEMVVLKNLEFTSFCEHHMLPFVGKAHIAYVPDKKVLGVSKLSRLFDIYARRLQIQERLCQQVTAALDEHLKPRGSACVIEAKHLCMSARGVGKQHSEMVTSSLTGVFRETGNDARVEFLSMIRG